MIRRIISRNNRHQIFINGRIANLQILSKITKNLAEISGQHAFQSLLKEDNHLLLLDSFASLNSKRNDFTEKYKEILSLISKRKKLKNDFQKQIDKIELLNFQKKEIESAKIEDIEEDLIKEKEKKKLQHSKEIFETIYFIIGILYEQEGSVSEQVIDAKNKINKLSKIDNSLIRYKKELDDLRFGLEDTVQSLRNYTENIQQNESTLDAIEERLDVLQKLKRKYGKSLQEVLHYYDKIEKELNNATNLDISIKKNKEALKKKHIEICTLSDTLSIKRKKAEINFSKKIEKELASLGMKNAKFQVALNKVSVENNTNKYLKNKNCIINERGIDSASFMIAANIGETIKDIKSTASGGEISRVVLSIKAILAKKDAIETIVFDEADAGIGGETAEKLGEKLFFLAKTQQIICITHLAQIAKFAKTHFKIIKKIENKRTITKINRLNAQDKTKEIARMLSGKTISNATIKHAKELLAPYQ